VQVTDCMSRFLMAHQCK